MTRCVPCGDGHLEMALRMNEFAIARCRSCGLLQVSPMPAEAVWSAYIAADEYIGGNGATGCVDFAAVGMALGPLFARRMRSIVARLGGRGRLLDFGYAARFFLEAAGWQRVRQPRLAIHAALKAKAMNP